MMRKLLPITALVLGLSSGVALADHRGGDRRVFEHRGASYNVRPHRDWRGDRVVSARPYWRDGGRVIVRGGAYPRLVRRPIYVSRPVIRERYYNYYRRPALVVENYNARPGYYWVAGRWDWSGYEWIWQPGHYQPDPSYLDPDCDHDGYDSGYGQVGYDGYYNNY